MVVLYIVLSFFFGAVFGWSIQMIAEANQKAEDDYNNWRDNK